MVSDREDRGQSLKLLARHLHDDPPQLLERRVQLLPAGILVRLPPFQALLELLESVDKILPLLANLKALTSKHRIFRKLQYLLDSVIPNACS